MPRSTWFIVAALLVSAVAFAIWFSLGLTFGDAPPPGIESKGETAPPAISPTLVALVSLCTAIVSLFSGLASLALKLIEIRQKSRA